MVLLMALSLQKRCRERNEKLYQYEQEERKRQEEIEREQHYKEVARFRALLREYDINPYEWVKNQDLFKGNYSPEQIKAELKIRLNK